MKKERNKKMIDNMNRTSGRGGKEGEKEMRGDKRRGKERSEEEFTEKRDKGEEGER